YVLGNSDFCGVKLNVDKRVLIPRFETEILANRAVEEIGDKKARVLDLCTGSGCIASVIARGTDADIVAADVSDEALQVATENLKGLGVAVVKSDMFESLDGKFDLIVSNPPYVRSADIDGLQPQVTAQPRIALDGGDDGLKFYKIIAECAGKFLTDDGVIMVEVGYDQAADVVKLFEKSGKCEVVKDLDGIERIVICRK
ncbi:MAG: peptide chain release factor N(5)-glutamine methyltransferase, partial [Clostridiales bacterium]|nr:peptide chain release factor N(5)-glutamine methyltransferase [Clostridiales bacterium]